MTKINLAVILFCFLALQGCSRENPQVVAHFNQIKIGDTRDSLISCMGPPKDREYSNILGLSHETLSWRDGSKSYNVVLFNDIVVAKNLSHWKGERPECDKIKSQRSIDQSQQTLFI